jgi:hypothetical protein
MEESPRFFGMGQNSEKSLIMSKQIKVVMSLELVKAESCYRKTAASKQQQAEAWKSIEDDSRRAKKLRPLNLLQETTFDGTWGVR